MAPKSTEKAKKPKKPVKKQVRITSEFWNTIHAERKERFLLALATNCNVTRSAIIAGIPRDTVYKAMEIDPEFARRFDEARKKGADALEDEAVRRGRVGILEPVFQGGKRVGVVRKFSDTLLIFLLKGAKPDKYADRRQVSGANGEPLTIKVVYADAKVAPDGSE